MSNDSLRDIREIKESCYVWWRDDPYENDWEIVHIDYFEKTDEQEELWMICYYGEDWGPNCDASTEGVFVVGPLVPPDIPPLPMPEKPPLTKI